MVLVGLTGGIGSGKSTVGQMLASRGAVVLDADGFARAAVVAGSPGFDEVVERFGRQIVGPDGELDRRVLASIVFADEPARRELEAIVHPEVRSRIVEAIAELADTDRVVVLESPLLVEMGSHRDCDVVVVVTADPETRIARVVARGMGEADARARLAAQGTLAEQVSAADVLLDNTGTREELETKVGRLWSDLVARSKTPR
jgi:dephospho-CoA kinase